MRPPWRFLKPEPLPCATAVTLMSSRSPWRTVELPWGLCFPVVLVLLYKETATAQTVTVVSRGSLPPWCQLLYSTAILGNPWPLSVRPSQSQLQLPRWLPLKPSDLPSIFLALTTPISSFFDSALVGRVSARTSACLPCWVVCADFHRPGYSLGLGGVSKVPRTREVTRGVVEALENHRSQAPSIESSHHSARPHGSTTQLSHMEAWMGHCQIFLISQEKLEQWMYTGNLPILEMFETNSKLSKTASQTKEHTHTKLVLYSFYTWPRWSLP